MILDFVQILVALPCMIWGAVDLMQHEPYRRPRRGLTLCILGFSILTACKIAQIGFETVVLFLLHVAPFLGAGICFITAYSDAEPASRKRIVLLSVGILLLVLYGVLRPTVAKAVCPTRMINPVTDVCWDCLFPVKIGSGMAMGASPTCDLPIAGNEAPVCTCPVPPPVMIRTGMSMSFWEPARMAETVSEPWCFPSIGATIGSSQNQGYQSQNDGESSGSTFKHVHWLVFPADMILGQVLSSTCVQNESMDILMITEIDPLWTDDQFSALIQPEAVLFANPLAQLGCAVDAVAANAGCSNSFQPWCMGSWGSAYPLTGNLNDSNELVASAGLAARMLYRMGRTPGFTLMDPAIWNCAAMPSPTWIKHHYRFQPAMPIRGLTCNPLGRSDMIWGIGNNPAYLYDNNVFLVWRQRGCCAL